jgi:hypothetical protein
MARKKKFDYSKGYPIKYAGSNRFNSHAHGIVVYLPENPHKGVCQACGLSKARGEIKFTAFHHWWYAYQPETVKKNPVLVLENTSEVCFGCHQVADSIRALLYAKPERVANVAELLRGEPRARFIRVLKEVIHRLEAQDVELAKKLLEIGKDGQSTS